MARPELEIGGQVFKPREMGFWESVRTHVLYGIRVLAADVYYPYYPQFRSVADQMRLGAFYGIEAANAFTDAITPRIRSTLELQMERQNRWAGYPIREPETDPLTGDYRYSFVEIS